MTPGAISRSLCMEKAFGYWITVAPFALMNWNVAMSESGKEPAPMRFVLTLSENQDKDVALLRRLPWPLSVEGALNLSGNSPGNLFIFATLEHRAWWLPCEGESIIALAGWSATPYLYSPSPAAVRLLCMHCLVIQPLKRALCVCTNFLWWIAVWREKVAVFFVWLCPVHC